MGSAGDRNRTLVARTPRERSENSDKAALCVETQSRDIMAVLVHDVVAEAMRLGLHDGQAGRVGKANGARLARGRDKIRNG